MILNIFSLINRLNIYLFPYKSIELYQKKKIYNQTYIYYIYLYFFPFNMKFNFNLYKIFSKTYNKFYIIYSTFDKLKNIKNLETNININKPRSLFIKYDIYVNNYKLELDDKIKLKQYSDNCLLKDIYLFEKIELYNIIIYKNNKEFKIYNDIDNLFLIDINEYL